MRFKHCFLSSPWPVALVLMGLILLLRAMEYFFLGELITAVPERFLADMRRIELLMEMGNRSAVSVKPHTSANHTAFMTICTMVKNEAKYVREWVEFHSLLGVDRFVLYDNDSTDSLAAALNGTLADVTIIPWPPAVWPDDGNPYKTLCQAYKEGRYLGEWAYAECQVAGFHHCLNQERAHSRWMACVDVDEFFMPLYDMHANNIWLQSIPGVLEKHYSHMHGLHLNSFMYDTNKHLQPIGPGELIIETHTTRLASSSTYKEFVNQLKVQTFP